MSTIAINVKQLGKQYRYGGVAPLSDNLRTDIADWLKAFVPRQKQDGSESLSHQESFRRIHASRLDADPQYFWALRDVDFQINKGEVVGIIGRNGAGKSTLLKILSRITPPTTGTITYHGRIASLLEVGTGFHRELSGRENVFLNGSILGMKRQEIGKKFDEIVAFAEVEKFIDTPVKFYSSGMYVRLAFAVAAHLEPEILIVDEVLAVGDASFQRKCLGKMDDVAKQGRTVLFVSHNMAAILSFCTRGLVFNNGTLACDGNIGTAVDSYLKLASSAAALPLAERTDRGGSGAIRLTSITVGNADGGKTIRCGDALRIEVDYTTNRSLSNTAFLVGIYDQHSRPIFFLDSRAAGGLPGSLPSKGRIVCMTDPINLTTGPCVVNVAALIGMDTADHVASATQFQVEADDFYGTGKLTERQVALCLIRQEWRLEDGTK